MRGSSPRPGPFRGRRGGPSSPRGRPAAGGARLRAPTLGRLLAVAGPRRPPELSLIHISEPTRLALI
eukprot:9862539-Alexandrium_andersonii.AAC.1